MFLGTFFTCLLCCNWVFAQQNEEKIPLVTKTIALEGVNIMTNPDNLIEKGNLIIKNGIIEKVGKNVEIPSDAKVLKGDSLFVYPGFIDGFSHTGIPAPKSDNDNRRSRPDVKDPGNPPNEKAGILPDLLAREQIKVEDKSISQMRSIGITTSHVVPRRGMLAGKGTVVNLMGNTIDEMIIADKTSLAASLSPARRVFPGTIIGVMSKFREMYKQTEQLKEHLKKYETNPSGMKRPTMDKALEAMIPVVSKELPVFFAADDAKSIHRVLMLQEDLGFDLVLTNVKQGWHALPNIKAGNIPVFLSLDLPKEEKEKKEPEKEEKKDEERMKLEKRKAETLQSYLSQAATFEKENVPFGFSFATIKPTEVHKNLRKMIKNGLSEKAALNALTMSPAKMLGLEKSLGSIEPGKIGNVVVTKNPLFDDKSMVKYVIIEGNLFEYKAKSDQAKKNDKKGKPSDSN